MNSELLKKKVKLWLSDRHNLLIIAAFLFIFFLRLHYFLITDDQPLWWDESEYMASAKNYAGIINYELGSQRLPGFPLVASLFYLLGISNEIALRFFLTLIPAFLALGLTYWVIREMYPDRRVALLSVLIFSVLWEHIFFSSRFHTENPALIFELLAILILFRVYMKKKPLGFVTPRFALVWIAAFSCISVIMRAGNMMFVPAIVVFVCLLNSRLFFSTRKRTYISCGIVIALALIGFGFLMYAKTIPREGLLSYYQPQNPVGWQILGGFKGFYESFIFSSDICSSSIIKCGGYHAFSLFYYLFLIGVLLSLGGVLLLYDKVIKLERSDDNKELKSNLFNFLLLGSVLFLMMFIMRAYGIEYRWLFPLAPAMLAFTSKGLLTSTDFLERTILSKKMAIVIIFLAMALGMYNQYAHTDFIVKAKLDSYLPVKESGIWISENSQRDDIVISASEPQHAYYAERTAIRYPQNETDFIRLVLEKRPRYMVLSVFEPGQKQWTFDFPTNHPGVVYPVNAWFQDSGENQNPLLIIYSFNYTALQNEIKENNSLSS